MRKKRGYYWVRAVSKNPFKKMGEWEVIYYDPKQVGGGITVPGSDNQFYWKEVAEVGPYLGNMPTIGTIPGEIQ